MSGILTKTIDVMSLPPPKKEHWSRQDILILIESYRKYPCLWNVKSKLYKDRDKRAAALSSISEELKRNGVSATINEIKRKLDGIRCQYRREKNKMRKSKKSGTGTEDLYIPTLWFFDLLFFLNDAEEGRASTSTMDEISGASTSHADTASGDSTMQAAKFSDHQVISYKMLAVYILLVIDV